MGPTDLDVSDKAGQAYLKALPVNRRMRRRLQTSRWIIHIYDGKNEMASEELKKLEGEGILPSWRLMSSDPRSTT